MRSVFLIICLFVGLYSSAQEYKYAELFCVGKAFSLKVEAAIDSGEYSAEEMKQAVPDRMIKDETGKNNRVKRPIEAINYTASLGWEFVNAFPVSTGQNLTYYFYFRKKKY
jgi:hypothetical protein